MLPWQRIVIDWYTNCVCKQQVCTLEKHAPSILTKRINSKHQSKRVFIICMISMVGVPGETSQSGREGLRGCKKKKNSKEPEKNLLFSITPPIDRCCPSSVLDRCYWQLKHWASSCLACRQNFELGRFRKWTQVNAAFSQLSVKKKAQNKNKL